MSSRQSSELNIRPVHPDDAAGLYEIVSHPAVARTLLQVPSMEFSETQAHIERKVPGKHRLVAERDGLVVGSGMITRYQNPRVAHAAGLGLMVHADYWGQGIGSALTKALLDLADRWLNLQRIELGVFVAHPAAVHLYRKFGFVIEGKKEMAVFADGRWHDTYQMARLRGLPERVDQPSSELITPQARPKLAEEDVHIRPLHQDDASDLHQLWQHPAVARTTMGLPSIEFSRAESLIENRPPGMHRFVAVVENRAVGLITLTQLQNPRLAHTGDLGMMVHPDFWRAGVGSKLMTVSLDLADRWLNLRRLELEVNVDNPAAIRLYEKSGFQVEGTKRYHVYGDGRWADSHFMARIRALTPSSDG